mmetsp:Transcript_70276/g.139252  ORF Transcript_70276/g.139252 Transcript_70276/m.139252 type:complete len:577 (+) Transcript_70276:63-1793(+)
MQHVLTPVGAVPPHGLTLRDKPSVSSVVVPEITCFHTISTSCARLTQICQLQEGGGQFFTGLTASFRSLVVALGCARVIQRRCKTISMVVDAPAASFPHLYGKGGGRKRKMEKDFGVKISMPNEGDEQGGKIIVDGPVPGCKRCKNFIQRRVQQLMFDRGSVPFPAHCELCNTALSQSVRGAFDHIRARPHLQALQKTISEPAGEPMQHRLNYLQTAKLLEIPKVYDFHQQMGFDVARIIEKAPEFEERKQAARAVWNEAACIPPDKNWFRSEELWTVRWDAARRGQIIRWSNSKPPHIKELLPRCTVDVQPPRIKIPQLPALLPPPLIEIPLVFAAPLHLGIASIVQKQYRLRDFDLVCTPALFHSLTGSNRCAKRLWLQRCGKTVFCTGGQAPPKTRDGSPGAGGAVEQLLCRLQDRCSRFYSCHIVRIGNYRILFTNEVDASNDEGELIEIKTSTKKYLTLKDSDDAYQLSMNGSRSVLACQVDSGRKRLLGTQSILTTDVLQACPDNWINLGQRVTMLLDRILSNEIFKQSPSQTQSLDVGDIALLTFDRISRAPLLELDRSDIRVLPAGIL